MKFNICSDIHINLNEDINLNLKHDKDIVTLIAGDISGDMKTRDKWFAEQIKNGYHGFFVEGNHILYGDHNLSLDKKIELLKNKYNSHHTGFKFLENDHIFYEEEKVLLIGCILWSDFKYGMSDGLFHKKYMNKVEFQEFIEEYGSTRFFGLSWEDLASIHKSSLDYITNTIEKYRSLYENNLKVIMLTHYGVSTFAISDKWKESIMNVAYISDLSKFILNNSCIKYWISGHTHYSYDYKLNECRCICNPFGFIQRQENIGFNSNFIIEV